MNIFIMTKAEQKRARKRLPIGKKALLVFLALLLALVAVAAVAYSRYLHPTGEIVPGLYAVRAGGNGSPMVNFFLLRAGENYIAIDAGTDPVQTQGELQKLGVSADAVAAVFVTHADQDHIGSLNLFENAMIYTGNTANSPFPDIPHTAMADGEMIEISGVSIQCFHTPGHTIDSVSFLADGKYLFVGDLLVNPNLARYDVELQILYREKMLGIDGVQYVFTGHFGLFRDIRFFRFFGI